MAGTVYSTLFLASYVEDGASATYSVPDGYLAVVRDVVFSSDTGDGSTAYVIDASGIAIALLTLPDDGSPDSDHWTGNQVVTDSIIAGSTGASTAVRVSGFLLTVGP